MPTRTGIGAVLIALFCSLAFAQPSAQPADSIITNARVYTVNAKHPWADAIAIRDGKVVAAGTGSEVTRLKGPKTQIIDAGGRLVLPGFTDCHVHFLSGSQSLSGVALEGVKSVQEIQQRVKAFAVAHPDAKWIVGRGWSYPVFASGLPDKKYIDEVVSDRPVFLEGFDGHTYWANSKALALAGIDSKKQDPPNGIIVRDDKGEPTGALKEAAADLVANIIPKVTPEEQLEFLRNGLKEAAHDGVTRIHSAGGDFEILNLFDQLRKNGELTARFYIAYFLDPPELTPDAIAKIEYARNLYKDEWISGGVVKTMLDGVVESHTAAMLTPYGDDPSTGKLFWDPSNYKHAVAELDRRHIQVMTHAIGDGAVRLALDAYEQAAAQNKTSDMRHRVEHIETITADDIQRFGKLGVIASMQPLHANPDEDTLGPWLAGAGKQRESRAWAWQSIAKSGGTLAFGSDWPVVTINPWKGLYNAVNRQTPEGTPAGGWVPEQRVTLEQAIAGYTINAARAGHFEKTEGSLEPGKLADLIIIDRDLFKIDPHQIGDTQVLLTMVGGKVVYRAPEFPGQY
jgi:predicted amidohydrolase YtcJ